MPHRDYWLRRCTSQNFLGYAKQQSLLLSELGNAAARETLATATLPFAATWTDLFDRMLVARGHEFRWRQNGLGVGRDARIAYSSLLGRYTARAYLTNNENVRVLVPLDEARRMLKNTPYRIEKNPAGRGLQADWIGINNHSLVIAEAKGSFDKGIRPWFSPNSIPSTLCTAIRQVNRTVVRNVSTGSILPSDRWAVASRWATEDNGLEPMLLAWNSRAQSSKINDYQTIAALLHRADVEGILQRLGFTDAYKKLCTPESSSRVQGELCLKVGEHTLEPGFAAMIAPTIVQPLYTEDDLNQVRRIRDLNVSVAIVSLSSRYATTIIRDGIWTKGEKVLDAHSSLPDKSDYFATRLGLTVVWPQLCEEIRLMEG